MTSRHFPSPPAQTPGSRYHLTIKSVWAVSIRQRFCSGDDPDSFRRTPPTHPHPPPRPRGPGAALREAVGRNFIEKVQEQQGPSTTAFPPCPRRCPSDTSAGNATTGGTFLLNRPKTLATEPPPFSFLISVTAAWPGDPRVGGAVPTRPPDHQRPRQCPGGGPHGVRTQAVAPTSHGGGRRAPFPAFWPRVLVSLGPFWGPASPTRDALAPVATVGIGAAGQIGEVSCFVLMVLPGPPGGLKQERTPSPLPRRPSLTLNPSQSRHPIPHPSSNACSTRLLECCPRPSKSWPLRCPPPLLGAQLPYSHFFFRLRTSLTALHLIGVVIRRSNHIRPWSSAPGMNHSFLKLVNFSHCAHSDNFLTVGNGPVPILRYALICCMSRFCSSSFSSVRWSMPPSRPTPVPPVTHPSLPHAVRAWA